MDYNDYNFKIFSELIDIVDTDINEYKLQYSYEDNSRDYNVIKDKHEEFNNLYEAMSSTESMNELYDRIFYDKSTFKINSIHDFSYAYLNVEKYLDTIHNNRNKETLLPLINKYKFAVNTKYYNTLLITFKKQVDIYEVLNGIFENIKDLHENKNKNIVVLNFANNYIHDEEEFRFNTVYKIIKALMLILKEEYDIDFSFSYNYDKNKDIKNLYMFCYINTDETKTIVLSNNIIMDKNIDIEVCDLDKLYINLNFKL